MEKNRIKDVFTVGKEMTFFFDYGASWLFTLKSLRMGEQSNPSFKYKVLESVGDAPQQYPDWDELD